MEQIGDMLILEKTEYKYNHQYYKVKCIICGHEREVSLHNLKNKGSKHCCGSCKDDFYKHEFIGKKYGDYTVIKYDHNDMRMVLKCNICGNITKASISELKEKYHSPICCRETYYKNQIGKEYGDFIILDYNLSKTPKYLVRCKICDRTRWLRVKVVEKGNRGHKDCINLLKKDEILEILKNRWNNILRRTTNPNDDNYKNYGGRGIKCLFRDFIEFYDLYYEELKKDTSLTFDRIDVNGNYEPNNIRLISHKQQQSNKRNTHYFLAYKDNGIVLSNNTMEFGKFYNVNGRSVGNCLRGKSKSAGGWTFKNITKEEFEVLLKEDGSVTTKVVI